ncbi:MAG: ATP-binding protein [Chloroflexi bacterium]|nr:ATP-binding protein [Chloroflexota bacterium]
MAVIKQAMASGRRYQLLLENAHDIVLFVRASDGCIVEANRSAIEAYGYTRDELVQLRIADLRAPETRNAIYGQMGVADTHGILFETVHRRKDGSTFPVEVNSVGATIYGERTLMSVVRDVTARKRAEQEREVALSRTVELYENSRRIGLAREPGEMLRVLLSNSMLKSCNRAAAAVFAQPWKKAGDTPSDLHILVACDEQGDVPALAGQSFEIDAGVLALMRQRDEPLLIADAHVQPGLPARLRQYLDDMGSRCFATLPLVAGGAWYGLLALHCRQPHQISETNIRHIQGLVDQAAAAMHNALLLEAEAKARQEAERANELRLRFLAMISHELRTPLTSIKGFASTLLADDVTWPPQDQHEFIRTIDEEADKLTDMIDQILDLSRLEAGTLRINPKPLSLEAITNLAMAQLNAITRSHTLVIDIPAQLPGVHADGQRIAQVLTNLVDNASKYSPKHTTITVDALLDGAFVQVNVRDEGRGISPEERRYVFEAFRRGGEKSIRNKKGAGLGLAICKGLIEAHGGRLWIQERAGPGTTISFALPIVRI